MSLNVLCPKSVITGVLWFSGNTGNMYSRLPTTLSMQFLTYIGLHSESPLYSTVLHTHEQEKGTLHCLSCVCYRWQMKLDCVTLMEWPHSGDNKTSGVWVTQLLFKLLRSVGQFRDINFKKYLIICSPGVKHAWEFTVISNTYSNIYIYIYYQEM